MVGLGAEFDPLWVRELIRNSTLIDPGALALNLIDLQQQFEKYGIVPVVFANRQDKPIFVTVKYNAGNRNNPTSNQATWIESAASSTVPADVYIEHDTPPGFSHTYVKTIAVALLSNNQTNKVWTFLVDGVAIFTVILDTSTVATSDQGHWECTFDPPIPCNSKFQINASQTVARSAIVTGWDE